MERPLHQITELVFSRMKGSIGRYLYLSAIYFLFFPLHGKCAPTVIDWTEEVKLHDGRIIVIKRHDEIGRFGFPLAHRGGRKYWQFCYSPMGISWKSKPEYFPETFDIVNGRAYVKVFISSHEQCMLQDYPETDALYFVWSGKAWQKIDYSEYPKGLRFNMLGHTHNDDDGSRDVRGLVTIAQKEKLDAEIYFLMKRRPEITGVNEMPGRGGVCEKWKSMSIQTNGSPEIFLPSSRKDCK